MADSVMQPFAKNYDILTICDTAQMGQWGNAGKINLTRPKLPFRATYPIDVLKSVGSRYRLARRPARSAIALIVVAYHREATCSRIAVIVFGPIPLMPLSLPAFTAVARLSRSTIPNS